jgi:hypothetical protein
MGRIIAASNGLVDGTTIQIPIIGYHTMGESASGASVNAFIRLLTLLADEGAKGTLAQDIHADDTPPPCPDRHA